MRAVRVRSQLPSSFFAPNLASFHTFGISTNLASAWKSFVYVSLCDSCCHLITISLISELRGQRDRGHASGQQTTLPAVSYRIIRPESPSVQVTDCSWHVMQLGRVHAICEARAGSACPRSGCHSLTPQSRSPRLSAGLGVDSLTSIRSQQRDGPACMKVQRDGDPRVIHSANHDRGRQVEARTRLSTGTRPFTTENQCCTHCAPT